MHPRKLSLECSLLRIFRIPAELRAIIVEDYFPFVPNGSKPKFLLDMTRPPERFSLVWNDIYAYAVVILSYYKNAETGKLVFTIKIHWYGYLNGSVTLTPRLELDVVEEEHLETNCELRRWCNNTILTLFD